MTEQDLSRRERKKRETRDRILSVAREMLATLGFEATTLEQIAEEADVSKATFYNYFPNKDALLRQILAIELETVGQRMAQEGDQQTSPLTMIQRSLELTFSADASVHPVLRRVGMESFLHPGKVPEPIAEAMDMFVDLVRQAQHQGELRSDLDPIHLANAISVAYLAASLFREGLDPALTRNDYRLTATATVLMDSIGVRDRTGEV